METPAVKMEFAVQMTCSTCERDVKAVLDGVEGIASAYVDVENDLVLVETQLPSKKVQELLESTGKLVLFRGVGGTESVEPTDGSARDAAVAIFRGDGVNGLTRLVQVDEGRCVIEGTLDGLEPGQYRLEVHEYGDMSSGYQSCGDVLRVGGEEPPAGCVATVQADSNGRVSFHCISEQLDVASLTGRSLALCGVTVDRAVCSVIARSAGVLQNPKRVCTCDGVTLWDEAAAGRTHLRATL